MAQVSNRSAIEPGKLRDLPYLELRGRGTGNVAKNWHHLLRTITITQSIYTPYVETRVGISDAAGMFERILPVLGEEEFRMKATDSGGRTLNLKSNIYTTSEAVPYQNHRSMSYVLQGASEWYHRNLLDKVRKTFHDQTYSDMAAAIASEYLGKSFDDMDSSIGTQKDYFCPCLSPVQLIELFAKRADTGDPTYMRMFASLVNGKEKLSFKNIYKLAQKSKVWTFWYGEPVDNDRKVERQQVNGSPNSRVTAMEMVNNNNTHDLTLAGYASRGYDKIDIYRRNVIQKQDKGSRTTQLGKSPLQSGGFVSGHMESQITPHVRNRFQAFDDTSQYTHKALDKHLTSQPLINSLTQKDLVIESHGNFMVGVGDVVGFEEPRIDGYHERTRSDRYSGNYLVTSKTDSISRDGTHISKFVLSRESDAY